MAIYRNISMNFWNDTKVVDEFSPEDRYFMLYCLTNLHTNLCGCYEISIKQMARDTGYNEETINTLIERFTNKYKMIRYNKPNKELLIKNWHKYNWTKSAKLDKPLLADINSIKTVEFRNYLGEIYNERDTVSIGYGYTIDTTVTVSVSDTVSDTVDNLENKSVREETFTEVITKPEYKIIIDKLNKLAGTNYKATSKATQAKINARLNEGYTLDDFIAVIEKKVFEWKNTDMAKYLRPETLFGTKFESYLNQPVGKKIKTANPFLAAYMEGLEEDYGKTSN